MSQHRSVSGLEVVELAGIKIPLDPAVVSPSILQAIRSGQYEKTEGKMLAAMVDSGERVVYIGGGLGFTSTVMAKTGRAAQVVCVEGHPDLRRLIEWVRDLNGVDFLIRNAVIAPDGGPATVPFYLHKDFWGSSLLPIAADRLHGVVQAPVLTFGDLIREYAPTMYVVDIEVVKELVSSSKALGESPKQGEWLHAVDLTGVSKVVIQIHKSIVDRRGIKRVFDWFSSQDFVYNTDHSRGGVILFERV